MSMAAAFLLLAGVAVLAYANGANDISKGIATLVGSGVGRYRQAILWGSIWTLLGSLVAGVFSGALVATFSRGILSSGVELPETFLVAVLAGTIGWVLLASRLGLPVSTTHSITGALCGAGLLAYGSQGILWESVAWRILLPLLLSPLVSLGALWLLFPALRRGLAPLSRRCACAEVQGDASLQPAAAASVAAVPAALPRVGLVVDHLESCGARSGVFAGMALADLLHWLSSGLASFARGLNDAPKIVALGIVLVLATGRDSMLLFVVVALAMGLGSILGGRRVTRTLAERITPMDPVEALSANLVTSCLVAFASRWGLPVSTTYVSAGAITGIGLCTHGRTLQWRTVGSMLQAWVVTLPVSALLAAAILMLLQLAPLP